MLNIALGSFAIRLEETFRDQYHNTAHEKLNSPHLLVSASKVACFECFKVRRRRRAVLSRSQLVPVAQYRHPNFGGVFVATVRAQESIRNDGKMHAY